MCVIVQPVSLPIVNTSGKLVPKVVLLIESILGERSRTVARIKRENFHRGVSCLEPLAPGGGVGGVGGGGDGGGGPDPPVRGVSWDETVKVKERPQSSVETRETREETDKLREMISIRRGSAQLETGGARPLLTRGSSLTTQHVLKTSERPPLARGFSCQTRRNNYNFPTITLSRPSTNNTSNTARRPHTMLEEPKIDLLSAVSEIHDNLKENTTTALTEEETEDEFHEEMQGGTLLLLLHLLAGDLEMRPATNPSTNNDHRTDPASHLAPPALEYHSDII